jgi:acyl-CoA synthetase (AMP-forming)/AMP-acid ligase II
MPAHTGYDLVGGKVPKFAPIRIGEWLQLSAALRPRERCFVDEGFERTLTFAEVNARVNRLANALLDIGVRPGDRLAVLAVDSHCFMETLLASMKLGTTYVPLNYRLAPSEIVTLMKESGAKWLFVSRTYAGLASELVEKVPELERVVVFEQIQSTHEDFETLLAGSHDGEPECDVGDEDILGLAFTSGTTGRPKGVLQSHRMMKMMVTNGMVHLQSTEGEFRYSAAPMFHIGGMAMAMHGIALGFPNLFMPQFDPAAVVRWLQSGEITSVFLVPTMINRILDVPGVGGHDYSTLKSIDHPDAAAEGARRLQLRLHPDVCRRHRSRRADRLDGGRSSSCAVERPSPFGVDRTTGLRRRAPPRRRRVARGHSRPGGGNRHPERYRHERLPRPTDRE